jgi:NAD(P)-dependent dehydrogenase (short-subunit alcohol dehydrogenase family)
MEFNGKNVVVTGASRGLGQALVAELTARGARVVGVARGDGTDIAADVADPAAAARIAGEATALIGPIDVLINNASVLGPVPLPMLLDLDPTDVEAVFQANVFGPLRLMRALVGGMVLRGSGTVVSVSSDAAVEAYPGWGAYGASKAALEQLTRVLAAELTGTGVDCIVVDPGEMDTKMHADAMPDADRASLARPADVAKRLADRLAKGVVSGARVSL